MENTNLFIDYKGQLHANLGKSAQSKAQMKHPLKLTLK
jgi:hypothetical protein